MFFKDSIRDLIIKKVKGVGSFKRMKIYEGFCCVSISMIELDTEELKKYENMLKERVGANVLTIKDNENTSIYGTLHHYEKKSMTPNSVEGILSIYPGSRMTSISVEIAKDSINKTAMITPNNPKETEEELKGDLKQLVNNLLIPEIDNILKLRESDKGCKDDKTNS